MHLSRQIELQADPLKYCVSGPATPARACARGVRKVWSGPRVAHADVGIRDRRIQSMLTMFSKRSETYKQLIVAHLYRNSLIFEVGLKSSNPEGFWITLKTLEDI